VLIEKSEGCNSFGCICGHSFNFSKAPRGCGEGIKDFGSVINLAVDFQMPVEEAKQCVEKGHRKGIAKYQSVLSQARKRQIPISLAEVYVQAYLGQETALAQLRDARHSRRVIKKEQVLMTELHISLEEARQLLEDAKSGNESACTNIRQARLRARQRGGLVCDTAVPNRSDLQLENHAALNDDNAMSVRRPALDEIIGGEEKNESDSSIDAPTNIHQSNESY
jgi:hypothetical protein